MDTSITMKSTGRRHNNDEMRHFHYNSIRSLTIGSAEKHPFKNGVNVAKTTRPKDYHTRIGRAM